jgi:two-component system chemotaxis response regulator CheB
VAEADSIRTAPVIALVASAGGLQAVSEILGALPDDLAATVLVLIHQAPDLPSALTAILARHTRLAVLIAESGMTLKLGEVYVAPPGKHLLVTKEQTLALIASGPRPPHRPSADLLLTSMALCLGERAIAVVLSGGGNDGATGATAIHAFGGTVIATDEASSEFFSMPSATIEREHVIDHVVALDEIASRLGALAAQTSASARGQ